ncbi:MAG TPA: phosphatase PAP2 family protein [Chitinophagaceae bacterium]
MRNILCTGLILSFSTLVSYSQDTLWTTSVHDTTKQVSETLISSQENKASSDEVYHLKPAVDVPLTTLAAGWSLYAFTKIYSKDPSTKEQILALNKNDINKFDRWGADVYSDKAANTSDFFFYGSMPLPLVLLADKDIRKDASKIGFLYLEAMSITGLLYTGAVYTHDRYRPLAYNPEVSLEERMRGGSKNSFFAGHVALVATSTFFTAKVFSDYHPDSKLKYLLYGAAVVGTAGTAYLRHAGGKHFPSDILIGTAVGTLSGILVPHFHKNPLLKNPRLSVTPFTGMSHGLAVRYKL